MKPVVPVVAVKPVEPAVAVLSAETVEADVRVPVSVLLRLGVEVALAVEVDG